MAPITENCPLVALIKSCCASKKVLVTEAGKKEHRVSSSWSFDLSAGLAGPTSGQTVSGDQWPQVTGWEAYQLFSAFAGDVSQAWEVWCPTALGINKI